MITHQIILNVPLESVVQTSDVLENLIVEKRTSSNWFYETYKNSIFYDFWALLSSPVI